VSGPKCGEWSVESNLDRERNIASELRFNIDSTQGAFDALCEKWTAATKKYGLEFPVLPPREIVRAPAKADNDTLRQVLEQLRRRLISLGNELSDAESVHRIRDLLAKARAFEKATKDSGSTHQTVNAASSVDRREKLSATLALLDRGAAEDDRHAIERLSEEALEELHVAKFENALLEIQIGIQRSNRRKHEKDRVAVKARQLLDGLTGLEGQEVARLRHELLRARDGECDLRSGIEAEVGSTSAAAKAEEDRRYTSKVLIEELQKLGYSTNDGMETVLAKGGELEITNADLREYSVRFAVDSQSGQFDVHLTRESDAAESVSSERRLRDRSMEEKWCGDLASMLTSAAERGVVSRIRRREKPGVVPVVVRHGTKRRRNSVVPSARSLRFPGGES